MLEGYVIERLLLQYRSDYEQLAQLLRENELCIEDDIETAFGVFDGEGTLLGCGCAAGSLLKCFAISRKLRGQNALGLLVSALIQDRFAAGYYDLFVITRVCNVPLFTACGFFALAQTEQIAILENQPHGVEKFAAKIQSGADAGKSIGAIVMNCNPFTLGHRYLIETAAKQCDVLNVFVVEENRAMFPTDIRFRLVSEGTRDIDNVHVHLSGRYILSAATFPKYFLKKGEDAAAMEAMLDIALFAGRIAPLLHIGIRFAGSEPLDGVTARYNDAMRAVLPENGIAFCEIPRIEQNGVPISASQVRRMLREKGICDEVLAMVPDVTGNYLKTEFRKKYEL